MKLKQAVRFAKMNSRITPRLTPWLVKHPNGVRITNDKTAERIMSILYPSQSKSRAGAFHPSQLYQCKRAQSYGYYDAPTQISYDPVLQNLFNDGHFRHLRWQIMLLEAEILTDVEVAIHVPELRLEGSIDGVNQDEGWMFELKGTSQYKMVQSKGAMPAHIKQVHAYLLASGLDEAVIVYEDKSNQQWHELAIHRDPKTIDEIYEILSELNDGVNKGKLPERLEECEAQSGTTFNSCPYSSICHRVNDPESVIALSKNK